MGSLTTANNKGQPKSKIIDKRSSSHVQKNVYEKRRLKKSKWAFQELTKERVTRVPRRMNRRQKTKEDPWLNI